MAKTTRRKKTTREERTAYHEAGHAVAHERLRYARKLRKVTIIPDPNENSRGCVVHDKLPPSFDPWENEITPRDMAGIEDDAVCSFAGGIAEKRFAGRHDYAGASEDRQHAIDLASPLTGGPGDKVLNAYLRYLWVRAEGLVESRLIWPEIEAVAKALLERKTLTRKEVHDIRLRVMREGIEEAKAERGEKGPEQK